jgi:hypothetical protein
VAGSVTFTFVRFSRSTTLGEKSHLLRIDGIFVSSDVSVKVGVFPVDVMVSVIALMKG